MSTLLNTRGACRGGRRQIDQRSREEGENVRAVSDNMATCEGVEAEQKRTREELNAMGLDPSEIWEAAACAAPIEEILR